MFLQGWLLSPDTSQQHHFHPSHYALHQTKLHQRYAFYRLVAHLVIDYLFQPSLIHHLRRLHRTCHVTRSSRFHSKWPSPYPLSLSRSMLLDVEQPGSRFPLKTVPVWYSVTLQPSLNKTLQLQLGTILYQSYMCSATQ